MHWKDFLYYQKGEQLAVILLLILIVLTLILNLMLSQRDSRDIIFTQNDSLVKAFEEFQRNLSLYEGINILDSEHSALPNDEEIDDVVRTKKNFKKNSPNHYAPFPAVEKLNANETILLNTTDTAEWKKIPGIGSIFAARIVKYRNLLGGFVSVEQLKEVYGIDNELFSRISPYIQTDGNFIKLQVNKLEFKELLRHPYFNYKQAQAIVNLRKRKGNIASIHELAMLDEFTSEDIFRIEPYLAF